MRRARSHLTPTSASWNNLVERLSAELAARKLRHSAHRSVTEFEAGIRKWIKEWNRDPGPLCGPRPSLRSPGRLASYCQQTNASEH